MDTIGKNMADNEVKVTLNVEVDRATHEPRTFVDIYTENLALEDSQTRAIAIAGLIQALEVIANDSPLTVRTQVYALAGRLGMLDDA